MASAPCIRFVESDSFAPTTADGEELWWMDHYECDCGWESPLQESLHDGGRSLAENHSAASGHPFC